ncbi:MAG TPA: hypothetical protein VJV03_12540 [Pyrinomonadaceae bacterium]|nr:hypothetical protein [Pyrinomonadaceae bacterium]
MIKTTLLAVVFVIGVSPTVYAQRGNAVAGRWVWKAPARRNQPQTQFTLVIKRAGDKVSGTYSVDQFINGEWQGEDGNQTPFAGRLNRGRLEIEFDPDATVPGYQENVTYKPPTDDRKPSLAVLTLQGRTLNWRLLTGRIQGVPGKITLKREARPGR